LEGEVLTNQQIKLVAAEAMVPDTIVNGTVEAITRLGGQFTPADLIAAVLSLDVEEVHDPAEHPARFWARRRTEPDSANSEDGEQR
jgi:hypothetical protein